MLKVPRALTTIHMIGQRPKTAPSSAESATCPTGIEYTASATIIETPSATSDAHCAFIRNTPSNTNSTTRGRTAKIEVTPSEWDTGSNTCLYTAHLLVHPPGRVLHHCLSYPGPTRLTQTFATRACNAVVVALAAADGGGV